MSAFPDWRVLLVLARISNLPTVWTNCLAAWLLTGSPLTWRLAMVLAGGSLLYTGGMFLNDAIDASFDRLHRAERPIPANQVARRTVCVVAVLLLVSGWLCLAVFGAVAAAYATALLVAIVAYDLVHKRTKLAPVVMGGCRFLLYLAAAAVAEPRRVSLVVLPAAALAAYICGLSYVARREYQASRARWPLAAGGILMLLAPLLLALFPTNQLRFSAALVAIALAFWIAFSLRPLYGQRPPRIGLSVSRLLAGIVLVDWLAAANPNFSIFFALLFPLALILQRVAPAT